MFTYGDGISTVNLKELELFHKKHNKLITVTAVRPPARFGEMFIKKNKVISFKEKPQVTQGWINGGFFIAKYDFFDLIKNDLTILEKHPLEKASSTGQLQAFQYRGFWKCMDTKRDKDVLEEIYKKINLSGKSKKKPQLTGSRRNWIYRKAYNQKSRFKKMVCYFSIFVFS